MSNFRTEPFLWIHLSGLAAFPLCLEGVWLGLAMGDPLFPPLLERLMIATIGILPIFVMQWQRPFDIFSLLFISLNPQQLTEDQRKILTLFKTQKQGLISIITPVILLVLLWQIYKFAPVASTVVPLPSWRILGLLIASLAFLASNLFLQVPLSVLGVLLTSNSKYEATEPYALEKIPFDFTVPGVKVNKILPRLEPVQEKVR